MSTRCWMLSSSGVEIARYKQTMLKSHFYNLPEGLRCRAVSLAQFWWYRSPDAVAWHKEEMLTLLEWCLTYQWAVLGGDVWLLPPSAEARPDSWSVEMQNESWQMFVSRSIEVARAFVQEYPCKEGTAALFEPVVIDEAGFAHLQQGDELFWQKVAQLEENLARRVEQLQGHLALIRDLVAAGLAGQIEHERLRKALYELPYNPDPNIHLTRAERLRRDLLEYAIGWLMRVSEGFSPAHSEWAQLYGYLTGTEPFEGEYLCWKI